MWALHDSVSRWIPFNLFIYLVEYLFQLQILRFTMFCKEIRMMVPGNQRLLSVTVCVGRQIKHRFIGLKINYIYINCYVLLCIGGSTTNLLNVDFLRFDAIFWYVCVSSSTFYNTYLTAIWCNRKWWLLMFALVALCSLNPTMFTYEQSKMSLWSVTGRPLWIITRFFSPLQSLLSSCSSPCFFGPVAMSNKPPGSCK